MNTTTTHADAVKLYRRGVTHLFTLTTEDPSFTVVSAMLTRMARQLPQDLSTALLAENAKRVPHTVRPDSPAGLRRLREHEDRVDTLAGEHDRRMRDLDDALATLQEPVLLNWTFDGFETYEARFRSRVFALTGGGRSWVLTSYSRTGDRAPHASQHLTAEQARATAQAYVDLGDGYRPEDHDGRSRWTEATWQACNLVERRPIKLFWCRETSTRYQASDPSNRYYVRGTHQGWTLTVNEETVVDGRRAVGKAVLASSVHESKALAIATAQAYSDLGDHYRAWRQEGRCRMTEAIRQVSETGIS